MAAAGRAMKISTEEEACGSMNYMDEVTLQNYTSSEYRCRLAKALSEKPDFKKDLYLWGNESCTKTLICGWIQEQVWGLVRLATC